ncbi:hypothetical protein MLD38_034031 [Melastoma candidum]|uniref:Uncharacterized protein n=1 Tax=Melastoma candidum TaxID=119954 RepID=A0ACB9M8F8_9MYRT|nr:hypothetical protein MLD38_034031 [Melastoma candidum]
MDNNEESKRNSRPRSPATPLSPIDEAEAGSSPLELHGGLGFGPASDDESGTHEDYNMDGLDDYEYFSRSQFLEGEGSNSYRESDADEEEDDDLDLDLEDIDPDELSYEELIELGEIIGEESRGIPREQAGKCLRSCLFKKNEWVTEIDRCVICQVEYEEGEGVVAVNPCNHPYHVECITQWLLLKRTCPICSSEVSPTKDCV